MANQSNLAIMLDTGGLSSGLKIMTPIPQPLGTLSYSFLIKAKHALILRENLLASNMELIDVANAQHTYQQSLRR